MSAELNSRYTLRNAVPLVMLLLVLLIFALSYTDSVLSGRAAVRARARADAVLDAEHLARLAQREFKERPGNVASDVSVASTEPRTAALALINPVGRIEIAHRLVWRGQPAQALIAHFSPERFLRVIQGRMPDVQEFSDPPRVAVMVPYFSEGRSGAIRTDDRGVVYLEYDLGHEYALVQWDAQQRIAPLLGATLVLLLGLALLIRAKVARPLAQAERASLQLAQHTAFPPPLDESGPREIARLAHGFNAMVERLRQAQRDSDNSRARLQAIFSAAMDAIITVDQTQRITVINGAALSMFACSEAEVLGHSIELLIPERFRANHADHVQRYAQKGLTSRSMGHFLVVRARRMTGEEFPAEASISHIQVDGEVLLTVILRDVTDRQKAQDAIMDLNSTLEEQVEQRTARLRETTQVLEQQQRVLQDAHAELRTIFNTVTVGIALVRKHVILRCNRRLEEVFGYAAGELEQQTTRLWYPDDATYQSEGVPLFAELGPGQVDQIEQELARKDGSRFWARITCSRLQDASLGEALLAVIEDLSLAHSAELAILEAKEQAVEASAAKSHFLANMSHEIRTPMNAIIGLSYLLQKSELNPVQREQVRKVQSSSQHLMSIINDILDYSKVEAGKLKIEAIEFDLASVLDNVSSLIAEKAASKGLSLVFQVDPAVPKRLVGDPLRLGQIIVNFANNAVKFTEQGEVRIALGLRDESALDVLLHGCVTDSGIGITEDQLPQLFQSFSQADSSTTRRFGGTGLGLAICKQLAALMQGEVGVDSVAGQGSTFWFTARLQKSQALARPLAQRSGLYGQQVLVVDDSESARGVLRDMLADLNLVVHAVDSGSAALEALQREDARGEPIALVFLDWQMPQTNGIEVARCIPGLGLSQTPALVLVTGHGRAEVLRSAQQVGIETVLVKPVGASLLLDCVLRELGPKAQKLPARAPVVADATQAMQGLAGARILLVEDNQLNREVAGELLSHAGLRVDMAFDGQEALQRLAAQPYDLVLMDMQMPVMDGLSATRALRAMPQHADLPVVAMTANALPGDRQRCLEAGMNDHIAKPIEPDTLFAALIKWLPVPAGQAPVADAPLADALVMPATQAVPGELPVIAGLDTAAGLRRVRGNTAFYISLLRKFARNHDGLMETLQSDLQQGRLEEARRGAHTLKGLSASIGMDAVAAQAALLEQQIKQGRDGSALLQSLQALITSFVQQLVQQLPAAVPVAAALADPAELGRVCSRLGALLADDNLEAVEWLARHEALLAQALDHSYAPIADAVRRFDCARALSLLRIAAQSTGIALSNTTEAS